MRRKDDIMMAIYEYTSPDEIRAIASEWLFIDNVIQAIHKQLSLTQDEDTIKELEKLVWK